MEVLKPLGMEPREMRLKFPRDTFFSKGVREVVLKPLDMTSRWESCGISNARNEQPHDPTGLVDAIPEHSGSDKKNWLLKFSLPRGAYATMVIRQLMLDAPSLEIESEENESEENEVLHSDYDEPKDNPSAIDQQESAGEHGAV
jgi:tRNA pseudouridine13 synthase